MSLSVSINQIEWTFLLASIKDWFSKNFSLDQEALMHNSLLNTSDVSLILRESFELQIFKIFEDFLANQIRFLKLRML